MNNKLSNPLFFAMMFFSVFQVNANSFANVTLTCSTEKFPVKGGFKFINSQKVERYNIIIYGLSIIKAEINIYVDNA